MYKAFLPLCFFSAAPFTNSFRFLFCFFKLVISFAMFMLEVIKEHRQSSQPARCYGVRLCKRLKKEFTPESEDKSLLRKILVVLPFTVPAILYTVTNNLGIMVQMEMDPATYQVLGNFKILSTAILFRLIIRRLLQIALFLINKQKTRNFLIVWGKNSDQSPAGSGSPYSFLSSRV